MAAPFIWLFGTNGFLVLHALLMTACFAVRVCVPVRAQSSGAALIFAFAFLFVSLVPVYMVRLDAGLLHLRHRPVRLFLLVLQGSRRTAPEHAGRRGARAGCWRRAPTSSRPCCSASPRSPSRPTSLLIAAAAGVGGAAPAMGARAQIGAVFGASWSALFAFNIAITGDWNYQGGERKTFYSGDGRFDGGFPFQNEHNTFDTVGLGRVGGGSFEVLFTATRCSKCFRTTSATSSFGRHTGFAIYFFPGADGDPAVPGRHARSRHVAVADAGGRPRHGRRAAALHAVHLVGRRRAGRQSLFPRRLPRVPVSRAAAANRRGRHR